MTISYGGTAFGLIIFIWEKAEWHKEGEPDNVEEVAHVLMVG